MARLFISLPAYNEAESLPPLLEAFAALFRELPPGYDPLVIVTDDGSKDGTSDVCRQAARRMPVDLVIHPKNKGLGEAIKTGFRRVLELSTNPEDIVVCMDADDTHPPSHIPGMLKLIESGEAEIVIASRYQKGSEQHGVPLNRQLMSQGARLLFWLFLNLPGVRDYTCGYRAYRVDLLRRAHERYGDRIIQRNGFACTDELLVNLACLGPKIREVPFILRYDRKAGESKLNLGLTLKETFRLLWEGRTRLRNEQRGSR